MQTSKGASVLKRMTQAPFLMSIVLFGALLMVPPTEVNAQVRCLGRCEQIFAECLRTSEDNQYNSGCLDRFEACVDRCLGNFAELFT